MYHLINPLETRDVDDKFHAVNLLMIPYITIINEETYLPNF